MVANVPPNFFTASLFFQRHGKTAGEVAGLACFLRSGEAGWMTGQVIGIDGGMSAVRV